MVIELVLILVGNTNEDKCAFWQEEDFVALKLWWWLLLVWLVNVAIGLLDDSFWFESTWLLVWVLIDWSDIDGGIIAGCEVRLRWKVFVFKVDALLGDLFTDFNCDTPPAILEIVLEAVFDFNRMGIGKKNKNAGDYPSSRFVFNI